MPKKKKMAKKQEADMEKESNIRRETIPSKM